MASQSIPVRVVTAETVAKNIRAYTLAREDGETLPAFGAGAHIDVLTDNGLTRQYSLCGDPTNTQEYKIAVQLEEQGRGGSSWIHANIHTASEIQINPPRNHFELDESADHYLLIAGGIGITPIMLMGQRLQALGKNFSFYYLARSLEHAAFAEQLRNTFGERLHCYFSDAVDERLNIAELFAQQSEVTEIYTCGSEHLLQAILDAAEPHPNLTVHFERFAAVEQDNSDNTSFEIELARSGKVLTVSPDQTILEVLRGEGFTVETMCEEGLCGSCEVDLLSGEADHRDSVLNEAEKAEQSVLMVCCSRAVSPRLKLDI
ncbi:PDR/VanB family oxidoreductase [Neptunomonas sp. XY-337]|uniref:PDR/VanB family oxidoreductase n=1 Tax=Neptunomonas sp. XY-337 TaxID=2561897 RepID=UPI0010A9D816|nr:PDR/VanB family oxidoreductase [Neptunomonas sp. XY-337]